MKIAKFTLGPLSTNCYLISCEKTAEAIIIDPADEPDFLAAKVKAYSLKYLLATHAHFDHIMAAEHLRLVFQARFLISAKDEFLVAGMAQSCQRWTGVKPELAPPQINNFLKEGQKIKFGAEILQVIETPGHTPGSLCFWHQKTASLFTGDTLFCDGIGRTDLSYSLPLEMKKSLQKIKNLPHLKTLYPGHGKTCPSHFPL